MNLMHQIKTTTFEAAKFIHNMEMIGYVVKPDGTNGHYAFYMNDEIDINYSVYIDKFSEDDCAYIGVRVHN